MKLEHSLSIVALAIADAGCIPLRPTVRAASSGTILAADSKTAIAGAIVRVESFRVATPRGYGGTVTLVDAAEARTDSTGRWSIPDEHEWTFGILAAEGLPLYASVHCVFADGFTTEVRKPHVRWFQRTRKTRTSQQAIVRWRPSF